MAVSAHGLGKLPLLRNITQSLERTFHRLIRIEAILWLVAGIPDGKREEDILAVIKIDAEQLLSFEQYQRKCQKFKSGVGWHWVGRRFLYLGSHTIRRLYITTTCDSQGRVPSISIPGVFRSRGIVEDTENCYSEEVNDKTVRLRM